MKTTKVKKDELLTKVRTNREGHISASNEARKGYRKKLRHVLSCALADLQDGNDVDGMEISQIVHDAPTNHVKDYDRVIAMLEMDTEDEVVLDARDFGRYVLDDWEWKDQWLSSNSTYSE